jgi:hypothetical protein
MASMGIYGVMSYAVSQRSASSDRMVGADRGDDEDGDAQGAKLVAPALSRVSRERYLAGCSPASSSG